MNKFLIISLFFFGSISFSLGILFKDHFFILSFILILSLIIYLYLDLKKKILEIIALRPKNFNEKKKEKNLNSEFDDTPASEHPIIVSARKRLKK